MSAASIAAPHHCSTEGSRSPSHALPSGRIAAVCDVKKCLRGGRRLKKPRRSRAVFVDAASRRRRAVIGRRRRKQRGLRALIGGARLTRGDPHAARTRRWTAAPSVPPPPPPPRRRTRTVQRSALQDDLAMRKNTGKNGVGALLGAEGSQWGRSGRAPQPAPVTVVYAAPGGGGGGGGGGAGRAQSLLHRSSARSAGPDEG